MKNKELDLAAVMTSLRDNGVHYVGCYYSGGGDSGAIENMTLYGHDFKQRFEDGDVEIDYGDHGDLEYELTDDIENFFDELFTYEILNNIEDWWNNDGGYGSVMMCTKTGEYKNINNIYYTQTEAYTHEAVINV